MNEKPTEKPSVTRQQLTDQYDSWYGAQEVVFGDGQPNPAVSKITDYLDSGRVVDIGGGEGRDAIWLAEQGFEVTVLDLSEVGINKLKTLAAEKDLPIHTKVSDVIEEGIGGDYEAAVLAFVLHHMSNAHARKIIDETKNCTVVGGLNIISTFMNEGELYERNEISGRFYPSLDDMRELYADWEIKELSSRQSVSFARNKDGSRMKNLTVELIAQKPA